MERVLTAQKLLGTWNFLTLKRPLRHPCAKFVGVNNNTCQSMLNYVTRGSELVFLNLIELLLSSFQIKQNWKKHFSIKRALSFEIQNKIRKKFIQLKDTIHVFS